MGDKCRLVVGLFLGGVVIWLFSLTNTFSTYVQYVSPRLNRSRDITMELTKHVSNVRVICWIMTCPKNLKTKAIAVNNTWAKRCDKVLYASDIADVTFPTIPIDIRNGRQHLTMKTMKTFDYIYKHHLEDADWFMKADDDTYVILENLKYFLKSQDSTKPLYFGHHFNWQIPKGYHSGGSGYVISKMALKKFGERPPNLCTKDGGAEDVKFGDCMRKLNVTIGDTRDRLGRYRFYPYEMEKIINNKYDDWYYKYAKYGAQFGMDSLSDYPIAFHYIKPHEMYAYEYFTYHMRAFGKVYGLENLNRNTTH